MGRRLHSSLPQTVASLVPQWSYLKEFTVADQKFKAQQKINYDHHHRVCNLPEIPDNIDVWITTDNHNIPGKTLCLADTPRSYVIQTSTGELRRNRSQVNVRSSVTEPQTTTNVPHSPIQTRSRTRAAHAFPQENLT